MPVCLCIDLSLACNGKKRKRCRGIGVVADETVHILSSVSATTSAQTDYTQTQILLTPNNNIGIETHNIVDKEMSIWKLKL